MDEQVVSGIDLARGLMPALEESGSSVAVRNAKLGTSAGRTNDSPKRKVELMLLALNIVVG
jgi:hypothetical protein